MAPQNYNLIKNDSLKLNFYLEKKLKKMPLVYTEVTTPWKENWCFKWQLIIPCTVYYPWNRCHSKYLIQWPCETARKIKLPDICIQISLNLYSSKQVYFLKQFRRHHQILVFKMVKIWIFQVGKGYGNCLWNYNTYYHFISKYKSY